MIKFYIFKWLSLLNRLLLPKLYRKTDLSQLSKMEMAIAGWKRWVTFQYFDARDRLAK